MNAKINIKELLDNLPAGVVVHQMDTSISYVNKEALRILRLSEEQMLGKDVFDPQWKLIDPSGKVLDPSEYPVSIAIRTKKSINGMLVGILSSDTETPTWALINLHFDKDQIVVSFTDVSKEYELPFREIVDKAYDGVLITSADNLKKPHGPKIVYANKYMQRISGYDIEELIGNTPRMLQGEATDRQALRRIHNALEAKEGIREVILNYSKDNKPYWIDISIFPLHLNKDDTVTHFAAIERDVTDIKNAELALLDISRTDPLTQLLNRRGFDDYTMIYTMQDSYAIVMLDIDHFKKINDDFSHLHGDKVLISLANTIKKYSRENDLAVRFGGEEFIIFLPNTNKDCAKNIAERIRIEVQKQKLIIDDHILTYTVSCGVATNENQLSIKQTLVIADKALYQAKSQGRNRSVVFDDK
ncbi:diguanylate cyclase [Francisella sp. 19X1-34]|uniref:sensor domain-containing diguanylate cyclase n=1 Tax=Francisella sp. 19X1-34 TaxID=3087177 RepID=UPI002E37C504|nr:diguanylate cyclase [Francisella sp. 19X1-34]MED7789450.1 diguanylate cyclase [Francisella sp. 19X1-34]